MNVEPPGPVVQRLISLPGLRIRRDVQPTPDCTHPSTPPTTISFTKASGLALDFTSRLELWFPMLFQYPQKSVIYAAPSFRVHEAPGSLQRDYPTPRHRISFRGSGATEKNPGIEINIELRRWELYAGPPTSVPTSLLSSWT